MSQGWGFLFPRSEYEWLVHQRAFAGWAFPLGFLGWGLAPVVQEFLRDAFKPWALSLLLGPVFLFVLWVLLLPLARASVASTARWQGKRPEELEHGIGIRWATGLSDEEPWWTRWSVGACWLAAPLWILDWLLPMLFFRHVDCRGPEYPLAAFTLLPLTWLVAAAALAGLMRRPEDETRGLPAEAESFPGDPK